MTSNPISSLALESLNYSTVTHIAHVLGEEISFMAIVAISNSYLFIG